MPTTLDIYTPLAVTYKGLSIPDEGFFSSEKHFRRTKSLKSYLHFPYLLFGYISFFDGATF